jgi:hypothetical protein
MRRPLTIMPLPARNAPAEAADLWKQVLAERPGDPGATKHLAELEQTAAMAS